MFKVILSNFKLAQESTCKYKKFTKINSVTILAHLARTENWPIICTIFDRLATIIKHFISCNVDYLEISKSWCFTKINVKILVVDIYNPQTDDDFDHQDIKSTKMNLYKIKPESILQNKALLLTQIAINWKICKTCTLLFYTFSCHTGYGSGN